MMREDGSVVMPPLSPLEQCSVFTGFVDGCSYMLGDAVDLWAFIGTEDFCVSDAKTGTRSHKLDRNALMEESDLLTALRALMDSRSAWLPCAPHKILGGDAPIWGEPV